MRLLDQFYLPPGRCFFTGSASVDKPILDTEHTVDFEGRVYIGGEFLEEAARLLGWHSPEEVDMLTADNVSLRAQLDVAQADLAARESLEADILSAASKIKKPAQAAANHVTPTPFSRG